MIFWKAQNAFGPDSSLVSMALRQFGLEELSSAVLSGLQCVFHHLELSLVDVAVLAVKNEFARFDA